MEVLNTRLLTYDLKVSRDVVNKIRWYGYKDASTLGVIISNLLACIKKQNKLVYSRNTYKKAMNKKGLSVYKVIKAIDYLEASEYVVNVVGVAHEDTEKRSVSYLIPTQKFLKEWSVEKYIQEAMIAYQEAIAVIELRDENKNAIPYRSNQDIKKMESVVRKLNEVNEKSKIVDGNGETLTNYYCRIFNESFSYGGRFYKADVLSVKNKGTDARLDIKIDGEPVCEIDFSNLHFRIASALEEIEVENLPLDVYSGILEDETNTVDRRIVKLAVNIMFNCFTEDSAEKAIRREINTLSEEDKRLYSLGSAKAVMLLIFDAYPQFASLFCSKDSYGRLLQNADSHLANDILEVMISKNITCLPVHDSFIVQLRHADLLSKTMGDCFRRRFNVDWMVPVGLSWKENGKTIEDKIIV